MKEDLQQFDKNIVRTLVPRPKGCFTIGTRWVFQNKLDETGNIIRNKERLMVQGYN